MNNEPPEPPVTNYDWYRGKIAALERQLEGEIGLRRIAEEKLARQRAARKADQERANEMINSLVVERDRLYEELAILRHGGDNMAQTIRGARAALEDMGVNCPKCGVRITIQNAGGYRTFCKNCATDAAIPNNQRGKIK